MPGSNHDQDQIDLARHRAVDIAGQFPDALNSAELDQVTRRIERILGSVTELRGYPLENGDEPAPIFRAIGKEQP